MVKRNWFRNMGNGEDVTIGGARTAPLRESEPTLIVLRRAWPFDQGLMYPARKNPNCIKHKSGVRLMHVFANLLGSEPRSKSRFSAGTTHIDRICFLGSLGPPPYSISCVKFYFRMPPYARYFPGASSCVHRDAGRSAIIEENYQ